MVDKKAIEEHIRGILEAVGEDPDREGLKDTPARVARMFEEVFEGISYSNEEIAEMFNRSFDLETESDDIVVIKDIEGYSYCEHHMALMYDMKITVAYLPHGRVLGLSKVARITDMICRRLQLQERIGSDIAETIAIASGSPDVAVIIEGRHSCMSARGIKKPAVTRTMTLRGKFRSDKTLSDRLFSML